MELGNLFGSKPSAPPPETFIAIQIQEDLVKAAIWQVIDGQPQILSFGTVLPWSDSDSLLTAVDNSLADALKDSSLEPDRVIFGLPESWIKNDKIVTDYSPLLKNLLQKLELKAIGFVVLTEAIIQHLRDKEGIPPTAIILELSLSKVCVNVVRLGKLISREEVARSDDLAKDVAEGLSRMELDQLPARFIIINGSDHEAEQQLVSYPWQDDLAFLHLPKVEIPDPHFSIEAIALSGGTEAAKSLGIEIAPVSEPASEDESIEGIPHPKELPVEPVDTTEELSTSLSPHDFGFTQEDSTDSEIPEIIVDPEIIPSSHPLKSKFKLPALPIPHPKISFPNFRILPLPLSFSHLPVIPITIFFILLGFGGIFVGYNLLGNATITVLVSPHDINKTLTVALGSEDHPSLPTLRASKETQQVEKTDTAPATGEALVGEKATGEVTVYNKTDAPKLLPKGTTLVTSSNLKFVLTEEASVSGKIARSDGSGDDYGKLTIPATASSIGADSNIEKDASLIIGTFPKSSLEAKVSSPFTGGTSRTVKAISKADQDKLLEKLTAILKQEATASLNSKSEGEQVVALDELEIVTKDFDKSAGTEASDFSLTLKAEVSLLRYQQEQLSQLILTQLNAEIPAGYTFDSSLSKIDVSSPTFDPEKNLIATAQIQARLLPKINPAEYLAKLKGHPLTSANLLLETIPGFQKVKYAIYPPLPILSKRLPFGGELKLNIEPSL